MCFFKKPQTTNDPTTSSEQARVMNATISYERARVMDAYKVAVSSSENKILEHTQILNHQIQKTLNAGVLFNLLMFLSSATLIGFSIYIFIFLPNSNRSQHYFGFFTLVGGIAILGLLFFRNPVLSFQQFIGNYTKLNLVFINYIRQANLLDATIRQTFIESPDEVLEITEATLGQFQDLLEITLDRANQLLDDM